MPIETNLNIPPYYDDFDETKNYYKILFQPGVSVQVRELNQLQSQFQKQIERFGDNIFKSGTIISGCNFTFHNDYTYVKILDNDVDGVPVVPSIFVNKFVRNETTKLTGYIVNSTDGFQSTPPDLKTIYITYNNAGSNGSIHAYSPNDILTIYDADNSIFSVLINDGGINFSNNDVVTFTPKIAIAMDSGSNFIVGDILKNEFGANVEIISVDTNTIKGELLVTYRPDANNLIASAIDSTKWTFNLNEAVKNSSNTKIGTVSGVFGKAAEGRVITDGLGIIKDILITNGGIGYEYAPYATVISKNNLTGINAVDLTAKNYVTRVQIDSSTTSVGSGYAFSVSEGVTYQKGYFLRVGPQTVIVEKYSNSPNNVVAGFRTEEQIVDFNDDDTLFDNVNSENKNAPGANRLFLEPKLTIVSSETARANLEFFDLVEWNDGLPFKQNKQTQYSRLGEEMAQRTFDESGNYVIDTFQVGTLSTDNIAKDSLYYTVVVDPGQAYINGYKAQTLRNYKIDVSKGLDTQLGKNYVSLNYGNYIRVREVGGVFDFATGASVDLYNTATQYLTKNAGDPITTIGTKIGTAKIRSMILENGIPGTSSCVYRIFVFDVKMNGGQNFASVRSIYYNGTYKGIADVILYVNPSTGAQIALLEGTKNNKLLFSAGVESLKNSKETNYTYRTIDQTATFACNSIGTLTLTTSATPNEYFPYTGELSSAQLKDLYVVPLAKDITQYDRLSGTVSATQTNTIVIGTGTNFFSDFEAGDYICIEDNLANSVNKIVQIVNSTALILSSNASVTNSSSYFRRIFPKNIPIPYGSRTGLTGNTSSGSQTLNLYLNHSNGYPLGIEGSGTILTAVAYNIERRGVSSSSKTANRKQFVKIRCANSTYTTRGPWCLGVPDIFRLRNVYLGTSSSVNTSSKNVTQNFYIDHNQNSNYLDLGWLFQIPKTKLKLNSSNWLLIEFDYFTGAGSGGYFDTVSYLNTSNSEVIAVLDATPLANLTTSAASFEVPEIYTYDGKYYDLLNTFDFRPAASLTASPVTNNNIASATVNPSSVVSFSNSDKKFPYPDTTMFTTVEQYLGRVDSVFIAGDEGGRIYVLKGISSVDPRKRLEANHPKDSLKLQSISVPPYPNITMNLSGFLSQILATGIANEKTMNLRLKTKVIRPIYSTLDMQLSQPMVYTMEDIGNLERRIADLEYYVGLSILETSITNKVIPSSVDRTLNRFKFGFFADDFSTENYSDIDNPQFAAAIEPEGDQAWGISKSPLDTDANWANSDKVNPEAQTLTPTKLVQKKTNRCVPPKQLITVTHHSENIDYVDHMIITQMNATKELILSASGTTSNTTQKVSYTGCPLPKEGTVQTVSNGVITSTSTVTTVYDYYTHLEPLNAPFGDRIIDFNVNLGKTGTITYFGDHHLLPNSVEIYQGNALIASSNTTANLVQAWTATDLNMLKSYSTNFLNYQWDSSNTTGLTFVRSGNAFKNSGKISWTHNPANGKKYTIIVKRESPLFKFLIEYPVSTTIANTVTTIAPVCVYLPPTYVGRIELSNQVGGAWSCSKLFVVNGVNCAVLDARATGLKPNTAHDFKIDGIVLNGNVIQSPSGSYASNISRKNVQPMVSDASGKIYFRIYFNASAKGFASTQGNTKINNNWLAQVYTAYAKNTQSWGSSGYSIFELVAVNSSAKLNVARRKPEITFSTNNPNGNP